MLRTFLRIISIYLSFTSFKGVKLDKKKHKYIKKIIENKSHEIFKKNSRLLTHKNLADEIIKVVNSKRLHNFLRNSFIQKIFFVHNRLFIFFELRELKKDKNWEIWKKLIRENDIGNPVRYFLYPQSSGNRIRQVFIIKKFIEQKKNLKLENINKIIEIGGGYGCMADIFKKINHKISYTIYDMYEANLLQYYYLSMNNYKPTFSKKLSKLNLINKLDEVNRFASLNKNFLLIANWSISEFPISLRNQFFNAISKSKYTVISFQENFENINNKLFFKKFLSKLRKRFDFYLDTFDHYNGSLLNKNKHYILTIIRK